MTSVTLLEQLINGLTLGGISALIALGYTMVYGVLRMINFAHSELFMLGAILGGLFLGAFDGSGSWWGVGVVFFVTMVLVGFFGVLVNRVAYAPLRRSSRLTPLISATS